MWAVAISERPHGSGKPCAAREDRRLRNSRTLSILVSVIYAVRLCRLHRRSGSTVLAETPAFAALLGRLLRGSKTAPNPARLLRASFVLRTTL